MPNRTFRRLQDVARASNGVPVLQDIPMLQYLFGQRSNQRYSKSVVIVITPRKPEPSTPGLAFGKPDLGDEIPLPSEIRDRSGLDTVLAHYAGTNPLLQFRHSDMKADAWKETSRLDQFIGRLNELIYH